MTVDDEPLERELSLDVHLDAEDAEELADMINRDVGVRVTFELSDEYVNGGELLGEGYACIGSADAGELLEDGEPVDGGDR